MNWKICALTLGASIGMATAAAAEPYVDYTPERGAIEVTSVKVDPNHVDDYLTGLSKDWVKGQEMAKRHGLIDWFSVEVKLNPSGGANVIFLQHYPSLANLEPDKARDQAMMAEARAAVPKDKEDTIVAGYDKYRTFVSDELWTYVDFSK
ncbi:MAG TPA: hypothetical protein VG227_07815 [Caulobacteraceae bacterium]|jgi:hypothetical protein|nr:hypothetical protein [Caulobacteraceae bacterium]